MVIIVVNTAPCVFPMAARKVFVAFIIARRAVVHVKDGLLRKSLLQDTERHVIRR